MARKRYRSRRRTRRRYRRRKMRIGKTLLGNSRVVKHKYCMSGQQIVQNPANLAVIETFRLLSPADPGVDPGGSNFKVLGFDEMHSLFANCQVLGVKARITWLPVENTHPQVYWSQISKTNEFGQPSQTLQTILNQRNCTYKYSMTNPGTTGGTTLVRKHSPKKYNQFKDYKDAEEYQCIPATSLVSGLDENYLNFGYSSTHSGTGSIISTCDYALVMDYIIRWFGPVNPGFSIV